MPDIRHAAAVVVTLAAVLTAGCAAKTADYSTIGTRTPTTSEEPQDSSSRPVPIAEYLNSVGVTGQQVPLGELTDLTVTLPRPPGWTKYANPNFSPGTEAIAKNNTYPTAMVMVFKLSGNFDVAKALEHGDDSAELSANFKRLNYSNDDFEGFPSAMVEGSYDLEGTRLHTYNRIVIPVTPEPEFQRYLVQFTVTTRADKAAAQAPEVQQVIEGFSVAVK